MPACKYRSYQHLGARTAGESLKPFAERARLLHKEALPSFPAEAGTGNPENRGNAGRRLRRHVGMNAELQIQGHTNTRGSPHRGRMRISIRREGSAPTEGYAFVILAKAGIQGVVDVGDHFFVEKIISDTDSLKDKPEQTPHPLRTFATSASLYIQQFRSTPPCACRYPPANARSQYLLPRGLHTCCRPCHCRH